MQTPILENYPHAEPEENDALLPGASERRTHRRAPRAFLPTFTRWKANPMWLIPVALIPSMSRGVTMSPRITVYTAVACRALHREQSPGLNFQSLKSAALDCSGTDISARAVKIQASITTLMNILSAITTGFWSRLGDNHGRKPVLALFLAGALAMEVVHVLVMNPDSIFGIYAEQFILVGPILEGLVGALSSYNGIVHSYTSDCTRHGSRSKVFSTLQGTIFIGLSLGPWLTGLIFPPPADVGSVDNFFYVSISLLAVTFFYVIFLCPESRQPTAPILDEYDDGSTKWKTSPFLSLRRIVQRFLAALMLPITMFAPRRMIGRPSQRNYNLTLVGVGLFLYIIQNAVSQTKFLYAQHAYSWTTDQLGHYISLLFFMRAFHLLLLLPIIISYLKPKTPLADGAIPNAEHITAELRFDKYLAQCSLALDCIADTLITIAASSSQTFVGLSCLSSFTSGGNPALHSLGAVCLHAAGFSSEVGALFGGMAVLSALAHIISPSIFAFTYASTVAYFPKTIFALAAALLSCAVLSLGFINSRLEDVVIHETSGLNDDDDREPSHSESSSQAPSLIPRSP